ncbi:serologically defined colon cancer antigen 3 [Chelydra serpentina]|uniref:Endosome-associated-trafficking regulator 1 n=2 Tax=Chelydra serpentina TaxID=8475 RepID=A0A8T1TA88_CHESE|nr:serologically defined colon cancer antigen 3 [Chelydra serpentina]
MAGHTRAPAGAPRSPSPNPHLWGGEEPGEANPFSFREFVRSQGRSAAVAGGGGRDWRARSPPPARGPHLPPLSPQEAAGPPPPLRRQPPEASGLSLRLPAPFFPDPSAGDAPLDEEEEEAEWSGCYQPSAVEQAHLAGRGGASPGLSAADSDCTDWSGLELEDSAPWQLDQSDPLGYAALGPGDQSPASAGGAGDGRYHPLQPAFRELQEENARLRSKVNHLHFFSETQTDKVKKLEKKLEENKIKEQKEAQDLEAMVQHVEQNLQLMTKRAVKAENNVVKLKQENALLQVQLKNYKTENETLKTGQSASLAVVKQNADIALQNLLRVITNSRSSIKQLVSGAESLQLVAELLKSIDRISEISDDGP